MPREPERATVEEAVRQLESVRSDWLRRPGVTAVDVGFKISEGTLTDQLALRVHVERKLPVEAVPDWDVFNVSGEAAETVGPFPVDVIEAAYEPAATVLEPQEAEALDRRSRVEPLVGGVSVGNPRVTAGTLGAIVWDRKDCSVNILSNWHVLVGSPSGAAGEPIYQPGKLDGGRAADTVATLNRSRLDRDMDAALARLNGARPHTRDVIGLAPIAGIEPARLGMEVAKSGRTTGLTEGIVDGVSASVSIAYDHGTVTFHDQIHIVPKPPWPSVDYEVSRGGDSGSVWVEQASGKAVGLHFAGERDPAATAENAMANRIEKVAAPSGLDFSFTPLFCPPRRQPDRDRVRSLLLCWRYPWLCRSLPFARFGEAAGAPVEPLLAASATSPGASAAPCPTCGRGGAPDQARELAAELEALEALVDAIVDGSEGR